MERAEALGGAILELCVAAGGTITGEHGVGREKINQMCAQFSEAEIETFAGIKAAFDPAGLLNPGKAIPTLARCAEFGAMHVQRGPVRGTGAAVGRRMGPPAPPPFEVPLPRERAGRIEAHLPDADIALAGRCGTRRRGGGACGSSAATPRGSTGGASRARSWTSPGHRGVIAYEPSELVITARAGTPIGEIEALLAAQGQMLAFEPPVFGPASTLGGVVAAGLSGPRRPFVGAVRDFVLGVTVLDGRGRSLREGGTVFKNVAGFDAFRLMAGALGCLGVLLDVSLRLAPRPRAEVSLAFEGDWPAAGRRIGELMRRPLPLSGAFHDGERLRLRLSGPEAAVAAAARELGGEETPVQFWDQVRHLTFGQLTAPRLWRLSVPQGAPIDGLDGRWLWDWGGAQRWLVADEGAERVRAAAPPPAATRRCFAAPARTKRCSPPRPPPDGSAPAAEGGLRPGGGVQPRPDV